MLSHAPSPSFAIVTTTSVTPVASAPVAFMSTLLRAARSFGRRRQCCTIPTCERVNEASAPIANKGFRRSVIPSKTTSRRPAMSASTTIPCEKTSRRPRCANDSGRWLSSAKSRQMRGKSAKLVLAERARMETTAAIVRW